MGFLEITLNGSGSSIHAAERAILVLEAKAEGQPNPAHASAVVTRAANTIRDAIAPYCPQDEAERRTVTGAAIAHYSMSTLDTSSSRQIVDGHSKTYETVYAARALFNIKFHDFAVLNKLATQFSAMDHVKISRIDWDLTDATLDGLKGGARKRAAQDAIAKAIDYAEAFAGVGREKVRPVTVSESTYYNQSTRPQLHYGKGMRGRVTGSEELQFEPEDVRLEVTVTAKFHVEF
jgi:uncharacterized protein YggE